MSEKIANTSDTQANAAASATYQQWRLLKDALAGYGVVAGGMAVIVAVVMIFFYLLYVVYPLFVPATAQELKRYLVPQPQAGKTLLLATEEQNEVAARFTQSGQIIFFQLATGDVLKTLKIAIPDGVQITSFAQGSPLNDGIVAYGLSNGTAIVLRNQYKTTYPDNVRVITPAISYPLGEQAVVLDDSGAAINKIAVKSNSDGTVIVAQSADKLRVVSLAKEESLFADESALARTESVLTPSIANITQLLLEKEGNTLYVLSDDKLLSIVDLSDKASPVLVQALELVGQGQKITAASFLNGDLSLMIGDSSGHVAQWTKVRAANNKQAIQKIRDFKVADKPVLQIVAEQRRKGFITVDAAGDVGVYNSTAERELIKQPIGITPMDSIALSPRADAFLLQFNDGSLQYWQLQNEHPEVSFRSLWQQVWYESYPKPDYIWQSSASNNDFEPKYSLIPLVFGTLKAAFYAMLIATPLALLGAMYTAYFMAPPMRQYVKPAIELMGALPTVILGFLAGLWLAPFIEEHLSGLFAMLIIVPLGVMGFAFAWQYLPKSLQQKMPEGCEALLLVPVILVSAWLAFAISVPMEAWLFNGTLRDWFKNEWGIGYDQRNALVVGFAMGFAVIPSIFSIAEDAIFSVPKSLTVGSLALGATPWQTMSKVVLLTASPGIFSAVMIGLGRAVGETMIVLMATGNTPVMDVSIFQGLRTLAANIAVEMPESEVGSSHYRILFLTALVLFMFTFIFNTLAEVIRQRLREKYSSL